MEREKGEGLIETRPAASGQRVVRRPDYIPKESDKRGPERKGKGTWKDGLVFENAVSVQGRLLPNHIGEIDAPWKVSERTTPKFDISRGCKDPILTGS